ncbi:colicin V synthesis protein [Intrasporangium oryzae NRRL B-24470]|uniref:Colicin V synthesis protein n=1 Tax=Intrasporangium oryzae NRRL B-24470 TaxID=1386089 RepID=W9G5W0_9MICO|nr:colicin V synthesis protein [Intrasporangium oryzae NRRL B-24470]
MIDLAILLVLGAYAASGYRQGLISSVFSLLGFFAGAMLAVWQLPNLLARWPAVADDTRTRVVVLVLGVVLLGWLGQYLGHLAGGAVRKRVELPSLRQADSVLGAIVVTLAAAVIVWFLGGSLRTVVSPPLAKAMSESKVLQAVNAVVPEQTGEIFAGFRGFLSSQGFPQVFGGLAPEPIRPVQTPDPAIATSGAIEQARRSVVKVTTRSERCDRGQEGTGWVLSPGRVVTNAHVVAGSEVVRVQGRGQLLAGRVVVFDPDRDLAIISVPGLEAPPLQLGEDLGRGDSAAVPGYPLDGPYTVVAARVRSLLDARGLDIYGKDRVVREIYSLNTKVQPGNSGGPLLDDRGRVVGVVFAKSLEDDRTGYALTLNEAKPVLEQSPSAGRAVDTGACLAG